VFTYEKGHRQALFQLEVAAGFHGTPNLAGGGGLGKRSDGVAFSIAVDCCILAD